MELTKQDTQMAKGMAVLGMVMLHLFCRKADLPYTPLIWCGELPFVYYLGLFGDLCVPVFCFCSGYAHYLMADAQKGGYRRRLPGKALRFLSNYWIVVVLFSILGLFFDNSGHIPGSWADFAGNMLMVGMNYNGAWWFVTTYLILLAMSPVLAALARRVNGIVLLSVSFCLYLAAYVLRFKFAITLPHPALQWFWNQAVLFGTSQFGYFMGMVCRKYGLVGKLRSCLVPRTILRRSIVILLPLAAFGGHCIVESVFVAPFTAAAALSGLFLAELPAWAKRGLLLLGKHSTNIWLVHMFFYLVLFPNLVFAARYPVLILGSMMLLCFAASVLIQALYRPFLGLFARKSASMEGC